MVVAAYVPHGYRRRPPFQHEVLDQLETLCAKEALYALIRRVWREERLPTEMPLGEFVMIAGCQGAPDEGLPARPGVPGGLQVGAGGTPHNSIQELLELAKQEEAWQAAVERAVGR